MIDAKRTVYDVEPTQRCASNHIAPWMVEPKWFVEAVNAYKAGRFEIEAARTEKDGGRTLYAIDGNGIAYVRLSGHLMKFDSKFGGTSTIRARRAIRMAAADEDAKAILLAIDSPGGTVAGTEELARDVVAAKDQKPVFAHIDDLGASAALWVASQADHLSANKTALVGSIGTVAVIEDSSKAAEKEGIEVHVISTGPFKGAGIPGTKVTDEHLAEMQELVDDLNEHFMQAVSTGRNLPMDAVRAMADGRVHIAQKAKAMGLINAVRPFDATIRHIREVVS